MAYEYIRVEREEHVTVITLNRPDVMNALHSPAPFEMREALDAFAADPSSLETALLCSPGSLAPAGSHQGF